MSTEIKSRKGLVVCTDRKVIATAAEQLKEDLRLLRRDQGRRAERGRRLSVKTGDQEERGLKRSCLYGDLSLLAFLHIDEKNDTTLKNDAFTGIFVRVNPNPDKQGNMPVTEPTHG